MTVRVRPAVPVLMKVKIHIWKQICEMMKSTDKTRVSVTGVCVQPNQNERMKQRKIYEGKASKNCVTKQTSH